MGDMFYFPYLGRALGWTQCQDLHRNLTEAISNFGSSRGRRKRNLQYFKVGLISQIRKTDEGALLAHY